MYKSKNMPNSTGEFLRSLFVLISGNFLYINDYFFFRTYDAEAEFVRMRDLGLFQSCKKPGK
jgi:hypothetical protein